MMLRGVAIKFVSLEGVTPKILPAQRGESFYVAGRGRDSDAVPSPDPIPAGESTRWAMKKTSVGNRGK